MSMTWIRTRGPFEWTRYIPWCLEWYRCFKSVGRVMVDFAVHGGWRYVRVIKQDDGTCIGLARHADLHEAFRDAGGQALAWRQKEAERERQAHRRGQAHEQRLLTLLGGLPSVPEWFVNVRGATPAEDERGYDLFVLTDVGEIGLQVKSSMAAIANFEADHKHRGIPCILVHEKCTDSKILFFVFRALKACRAKRIAEQTSNGQPSPSPADQTTPRP